MYWQFLLGYQGSHHGSLLPLSDCPLLPLLPLHLTSTDLSWQVCGLRRLEQRAEGSLAARGAGLGELFRQWHIPSEGWCPVMSGAPLCGVVETQGWEDWPHLWWSRCPGS